VGNWGNHHDRTGNSHSWQQLVGSLNDEGSFATSFCYILIPLSVIVVGANSANNPHYTNSGDYNHSTANHDYTCAVATTSRLAKCRGALELCTECAMFVFVRVLVCT